jgi:prepilin-type N-terminal cleavage/methylation domain-containing protein/prepilin-type processing-associated H-X9-DG protein
MYRSSTPRRGFTLVELLVVVAIIALLLSILLPSLNKARRIAQATVCASNQKTLLLGLRMYASDYQDLIPYSFIPGGGSYPAIDEPTGFAEWWDRLGSYDEGTTSVEKNGYVPYDPMSFKGGNFKCPLADEVPSPWLTEDRFSAHFSMNDYLLSKRRTNGDFITRIASGALNDRARRLSEADGQKVFIGDGRVQQFTFGSYFLGQFNHRYGPGWGQFEPWAVDEGDGSVWAHNGSVNLGYVDGHVSNVSEWGTEALEREFLVD